MPARPSRVVAPILLTLSLGLAGPAKKVAVQDFSSVSNSLKAGEGELLGDALREGMDGLPASSFVMMTRENITELLPPGKTLEECSEGQCEVEIGRKLGADYLVIGKVLRVDKQLVATVKVHRIQPVGLLSTRQVRARSIGDLLIAVTTLGHEAQAKLLAAEGVPGDATENGQPSPGGEGAALAPSTSAPAKAAVPDEVGTIVTLSATGGAATFALDGKSVCRDQETCQQELSNGKHVVKVSREGYRDSVFSIAVPRGEDRYSIGLNPKLGILTIRAQDAATGQALVAEIVVDGAVVGKTPKSIPVPLIARRIVLRAPDHADVAVAERPQQEGAKASVVAKLEATKVAAVAAVPQSMRSQAASSGKTGMVAIPAGCFRMGSNDGEYDNETPVHRVCLSAFSMDKYDVTQEAYRQATGQSRSPFTESGDDGPVVNVDWNEAKSYCESHGKRLPTEAEWEYAARAGTTTKWYWGNDKQRVDKYAWYAGNSKNTAHPVGQKQPNAWGLYDMAGNVWQWTADWKGRYSSLNQRNPTGPSSGSYRILRGGDWSEDDIGDLRSANRLGMAPDYRGIAVGFRCVGP